MKAGNRAPVLKREMIISLSHGNTLTWCCTSFVSLAYPRLPFYKEPPKPPVGIQSKNSCYVPKNPL
jgi:hypothetical protein